MTKAVCVHEFDEVCKHLDRLSHDVEQMTERAFTGLLKHNRKSLDEAAKMSSKIEQDAKQLTQFVLSPKGESKILPSATIIEVINELQRIKYSLDKIVDNIRAKAEEGVLFSDKALTELTDFFTAAIDSLKHVHDLILTRNPVLVKHIVDKSEKYEVIGREYAEEHQDRLIKGICLPKSSLIYLVILDSLKDVLRYVKFIALAFREES